MDFKLIAGEVTGLIISRGYEDLLHGLRVRAAVEATAAIAAAANVAFTATATAVSGTTTDSEVAMDFFRCTVNGVPLAGRFYLVGFREGDIIEFVVTMSDGKGEVYAARSKQSRLIWTLPYHTRGHRAQLRHDIKSSVIISAVGTLLTGVLLHYDRFSADRLGFVINQSLIAFSVLLLINFLSRWPFYKSSRAATEIFRTFGFADPGNLNLPSMNGSAEKQFCAATGVPSSSIIPWQYRYDDRALVSPVE